MTARDLARVRKLVAEATKAAKVAERNRFLIETLLSVEEYKTGKSRPTSSSREFFKRLGI